MRTWTLVSFCCAVAGCTKGAEVASIPLTTTVRSIALTVTSEGFEPATIKLRSNEPVKLVVTRKTDETCATDLVIDGTDIKVALPLNEPVEVAWTPKKAGTVKFGCAMGMMVSGVLLVE